MTGKKKTPKVPGIMRQVLARNVRKLMEHHYADNPNRPKALAKDAGVSLSTVQRILAAENGASLDNIESVALALQVSSYQLLIPVLDTKNPQVVKGAMEAERRFYRSVERKQTLVWED
jgi:transcriptional regulator with XRE-family HTH domain